MLALKNKHKRDDDITFVDDTHEYFFKGSKIDTSVTSYIHLFFNHFNAEEQASNIFLGRCKPETYEKYKNLSVSEIIEKWNKDGKESSKLGTKLHSTLEYFFNLKICSSDVFQTFSEYLNNLKEYIHFYQFLKDDHLKNYKPYRSEWMIYSNELQIAGSVDMLFQNISDPTKFVIYDWKRSKEIKFKNKFSSGRGPVFDLDDCNYVLYSLQLNMYKYILEKHYNINVEKMYLLVLHPNNDNYIQINIPYMQTTIEKLIEFREKQLLLNIK